MPNTRLSQSGGLVVSPLAMYTGAALIHAMVPIIINPLSGRGLGRHYLPTVERHARELGWDGELHALGEHEDLVAVLNAYFAKGVRHVVVGGGDGTITASLGPLVHYGATLGILPIGTGNRIALNLGLPRDPAKALRTALLGTPRPLDVGRVNGRYFSLITGLGWDGAVFRETHPGMKRRLGIPAYFIAAFKHLGHPHDIYRIKIDGKIVGHYVAKTVMIGNVGTIAPRVRLFPDAEPDDGLLDVAVIQPETLLGWCRLVANTLAGRVRHDPGTVFFQGKKITVTTASGDRLLQVDGDFYAQIDRLEAVVLPHAIRIMTPSVEK